ncbi:hypothetical protein EVA_08934 [gut metagenome]|uniref:Uncharacterized protein n=1 Tax=gut metagenome TaxID=749906 RepID=J9CRY3_9ZZZZ
MRNISSSALTSATISREDLKSVPLLLRVTSMTRRSASSKIASIWAVDVPACSAILSDVSIKRRSCALFWIVSI